jgi:hypothetical protein
MDPTHVARRFDEAVEVVAGWPGVWTALLAAHVADAGGRCAACAGQHRPGPVWPCGPAALALRARRSAGGRG